MFYFFYKTIIFSLNKDKDDIRSAYCKFSQLNSETSMKHTLVDQSKSTCYPNYFINNSDLTILAYPYCTLMKDLVFISIPLAF